jgi:4'-phosphopantetheinyl transferase
VDILRAGEINFGNDVPRLLRERIRRASPQLGYNHINNKVSADEVHVWLVKPEAVRDELTRRLHVLSVGERARMASFRFESDRLAYAAAHLLLRAALNWCAPDVSPAEWKLTDSRLDRPEVIAPTVCPCLRFNISHTRSLVACVVTREIDCGIDVEVQRQVEDMEGLAARVLSPTEISNLMALPLSLRPARFFSYWTLKEAYVKARGLGLSLPLQAVSFDLDMAGISITIDPSLNDHGDDWQFEQWAPTDQHLVAVAIRSGPIGGGRVIRHQNIPAWDIAEHA